MVRALRLEKVVFGDLHEFCVSGFEHLAGTLPTRFPAALGIGHDPAYGLANACALVYVAA